ncbi:MAG TPA: hypothetical protein VFD82_06005 [Planctomycetota bacterium]|nr:hypothetical protein [Planctomycetota bacterium]
MTGDDDKEPPADAAPRVVHLQALPGEGQPPGTPPEVRLRREFKGLTAADLERDDVVARLPGQIRSALRHLRRGDLAAAERALPGEFPPVLAGPGHRPAAARRQAAAVVVLALVAAAAIAYWLIA